MWSRPDLIVAGRVGNGRDLASEQLVLAEWPQIWLCSFMELLPPQIAVIIASFSISKKLISHLMSTTLRYNILIISREISAYPILTVVKSISLKKMFY